MKKLLLVLLAFIMVVPIAFAHPGRTDSNGGHWDRSTGTYHYHNDGSYQGGSGSGSSSSGSVSYEPILSLNEGDVLETQGNVNVRSGAGSDYSIVLTISSGSRVSYAGKTSGRWHYVEFITDDGPGAGWMYNDYLVVVSRRPVPTEEPEPVPTAKPVKKQSKKEPAKLTFKTGLWLFAAGFLSGMVILARYSFKVHERERIFQQSIKRTNEAFLEGKNSALNEVKEKEEHLAFVAEFNQSSFERYKAEAEKIYAGLPPADTYCKVIIAKSGQGWQLYHRVGSKCVENGKEVPLFVANMLDLMWCPVCMPPAKGKPLHPWADTKEKRVEMARNLLDGGK